MEAFLISTGIVALAEIGDKTQLLAMVLAARFRKPVPIIVGSLLNLDAVAAAARAESSDVEIVCAGVDGAFALDDAYCAGRIVELLEGERTDAAEAAVRIARSFSGAEEAFRTSVNPHERDIEEDLVWCTRENTARVVPRFEAMRGPAAEIRL